MNPNLPPPPPAIVFTLPRPAPLCLDRMADAIRAVEGAGVRQRGSRGEWGTFQIRPMVWRKYSRHLQWNASEAEQRRVALCFLADIRAELVRNGFPDTPFFLGLAFTAGVRATVTRRANAAKASYAERAAAVYDDKE